MAVKMPFQHGVKLFHAGGYAKRGKRGDASIIYATGNNCFKGGKVWIVINGDAMPADPAANPHPNGGNFVEARDAVSRFHPNPGQSRAPLANDAKLGQHIDDPAFQIVYIAAHIWPAFLKVKHDIGNPLARPVIGPLASPPGSVSGDVGWIQQIGIQG